MSESPLPYFSAREWRELELSAHTYYGALDSPTLAPYLSLVSGHRLSPAQAQHVMQMIRAQQRPLTFGTPRD